MYASIAAIDQDKYTGSCMDRNRRTFVESKNFKVRVWDDELRVDASYRIENGTGERGGSRKGVVRELILTFDSAELKKLIDAAVFEGMITLNIDKTKLQLLKALENLEGIADSPVLSYKFI